MVAQVAISQSNPEGWQDKLKDFVSLTTAAYDASHGAKLAAYPTAFAIHELFKNGANVPVPEFLTYFLFHRIRSNDSRNPNFKAVREKIAIAYGMLDDFVRLDDGALFVEEGVQNLPTHVTEYIGDACTLSLMNRVHGLTEADWLPIVGPPGQKILDYQYASDGKHVVQVEAKGAVVDQAKQKSAVVSRAKHDIELKKASPASSAVALKYGVIAGIPRVVEKTHCWLMDPEPDQPPKSARDLQLLSRMGFLRWIIWLISPHSHVATALQTRTRDLSLIRDPYELNRAPITESSGEPIAYREVPYGGESYSPFFATRSRVLGGQAGGVVVPAKDHRSLLFIGMRTKLLQLAVEQDFDALTSYRAPETTSRKTVECVVPRGELSNFGLTDPTRGSVRKEQYVRFDVEGFLNYSREGIVFGTLPFNPRFRGRSFGWNR
jgi:hypothetical protein